MNNIKYIQITKTFILFKSETIIEQSDLFELTAWIIKLNQLTHISLGLRFTNYLEIVENNIFILRNN